MIFFVQSKQAKATVERAPERALPIKLAPTFLHTVPHSFLHLCSSTRVYECVPPITNQSSISLYANDIAGVLFHALIYSRYCGPKGRSDGILVCNTGTTTSHSLVYLPFFGGSSTRSSTILVYDF